MILGREEWAAAGKPPLTEPITAEAYMALLAERAGVYRDANPIRARERVLPLLEWFIWPGDDDLVILPDRVTTEKPAPTRTDEDRLRDARAGVTRWTERLAKAEAAYEAAYEATRPPTTDPGYLNIPLSRRVRNLDGQLARVAQAERVRDTARWKLDMAQARVRKYEQRMHR